VLKIKLYNISILDIYNISILYQTVKYPSVESQFSEFLLFVSKLNCFIFVIVLHLRMFRKESHNSIHAFFGQPPLF